MIAYRAVPKGATKPPVVLACIPPDTSRRWKPG
jgi:hypothetical protein